MQWYKPLDLQSKQDMKINKTNKHLTKHYKLVVYLNHIAVFYYLHQNPDQYQHKELTQMMSIIYSDLCKII